MLGPVMEAGREEHRPTLGDSAALGLKATGESWWKKGLVVRPEAHIPKLL